jgi:hypothetical protein
VPGAKAGAEPRPGLEEAAALWWRPEVTAGELARQGRRWTVWTAWITIVFSAPGVLLLLLSPLTLPVAVGCFAHAWLIPWLQARRGARAVVPLRDSGGVADAGAEAGAGRVALGLLADLVGHAERDLLAETGLALERGRLGVWLVGERGALMVRPGGRRMDSWCVTVGEPEDLPPADRIAHLLLALREDEPGFAKVANLGFSGAPWRVRRGLPERCRPALAEARRAARVGASPLSRGALVPIDEL